MSFQVIIGALAVSAAIPLFLYSLVTAGQRGLFAKKQTMLGDVRMPPDGSLHLHKVRQTTKSRNRLGGNAVKRLERVTVAVTTAQKHQLAPPDRPHRRRRLARSLGERPPGQCCARGHVGELPRQES